MRGLSTRAWLLLAAVVLGGLFVLWLQVGLLASTVQLAIGGKGLTSSLSSAVDQIKVGDLAVATDDVSQATAAGNLIDSSAHGAHMAVLAAMPGLGTAVRNWQHLGTASGDITAGVAELVDLYGDLAGKNGGAKIFANGTIDIDRLKQIPPRVGRVDAGLTDVIDNLEAIDATGPAAQLLAKAKEKALKTAVPVQQGISALVDMAPYLPDALGANGTRRYLIAIDNQAEMRASGGAPLSLVMVEFDKGRITIPIKGQTSTQLFPPVNRPVTWWGPGGNPFFSSNPRTAPFVIANTHPNLLTSAREMSGAWSGGNYPKVDGVVTLDLTAIGAMLDATGAIESPTYGTVTGAQLGQILLIDAYAKFGQDDAAARQEANQQLIDSLLTKLLGGDQIVTAAQAVAGTAPGRHFQAWLADPHLEAVAIKSGAAGDVKDKGTGDWSALYTQNGNQSKVDVFQQRTVNVSVQLQANGSAQVQQTMTIINATPPDRPAEGTFGRIGYETTWLKNAYLMYVPDAAINYSATYPMGFNVRPFRNHKQFGRGFVNDGYGQKLVRVVGWTPPGGTSTVGVTYTLPSGTFTKAGPLRYSLTALPQSLWLNSTITVRVTAPAGYAPVAQDGMLIDGATAQVSAVQDAPVNLAIDFTAAKGNS